MDKHAVLRKCERVHGCIYDYRLVPDDVASNAKINIICPQHGEFMQRLCDHLSGCGCPTCGKYKQDKHKRKSKEHYVALCNNVHNNKYDYSLLTDNVKRHDKVTIICPEHGSFEQRLNSHVSGSGCRLCSNKTRQQTKQKGREYFISVCCQVHDNKYDYTNWPADIKSTTLVTIVCPEHGEFTQRVNSHSQGHGCSKCRSKRLPQSILAVLLDEQTLRVKHHVEKLPLAEIANQLDVSPSTVKGYIDFHDIEVKHYFTSVAQTQISDYVKSLSVDCVDNDRNTVSGIELDVFIPDYSLAIEYDGLYWHNEKSGKDQNYHLHKTVLCEKQGIRLLHIFEDEWRDMQQQCKDTIKHLLGKSTRGEFARNTTIKQITWKEAKQFLDKYHLLGSGHCGNYRIGAYDSVGNLIGVMVFGNQNNERSQHNVVEMRRFVTNKKNNPGLGSKMFKYAVNTKQYDQVIAFVDRRWFTGDFKSMSGFEFIQNTNPSVWWTTGSKRYHRRVLTKQQLIQQHGFDPSMTKVQMMNAIGLYRIWDCGKKKLQWTR